jgi:hypothetical protein
VQQAAQHLWCFLTYLQPVIFQQPQHNTHDLQQSPVAAETTNNSQILRNLRKTYRHIESTFI